MEIRDIVYGEEEIKESVLIDLINCDSVQRLKGVSQFGMPDEYYHLKSFSRYDHSVGTMILLKHLEADLEEQIAGLLHDVSHTAFSHVGDWVLGDPIKEGYQDGIHLETLKNSEIFSILEKQGFDYKDVGEIENYSLLEQPIPGLCADRVDYSLREVAHLHSEKDARKIFKDLRNIGGKVILGSLESAELFAEYYIKMNRNHWTGSRAKAHYHILAETLRIGLEEKIISLKDLMETDQHVLDLLNQSENEEILYELKLLRNGFSLERTNSGGIILQKKFRYIDPLFMHNGRTLHLSEFSKEYKELLEREKQHFLIKEQVLIIPA